MKFHIERQLEAFGVNKSIQQSHIKWKIFSQTCELVQWSMKCALRER